MDMISARFRRYLHMKQITNSRLNSRVKNMRNLPIPATPSPTFRQMPIITMPFSGRLTKTSLPAEPASTENPFTDVTESDYFYKAVLWAVEKGVTNGTTDTTFGPNGTCTSAHVVTFLWRANGKPAANTDGTNYYDEAVAWANSQKLLDGTAVPFAPDNLSPRADIVTYLYRVLGK